MTKTVIPIFYACDTDFAKYTQVSLYSLIKNANKEYEYKIYILHTDLSPEAKAGLALLQKRGFEVIFTNVKDRLEKITHDLPIRDYYSKTTYYRFFIAEAFPEYDKAIYIDSDTVVTGDISELYMHDVSDYYVGACHERAMTDVDTYGTYVESVVGVSRYAFFNAGVMLINTKVFREKHILEKFISLLSEYNFVVTQDEDYLNLICKDKVLWLDSRFNTEVFGEIPYPIEEAKIIHYIMTSKPWHYRDCRFGDIFWKYAKHCPSYNEILTVLESYTDEERERDKESGERLLALAEKETKREDNYLARLNGKRSADRVEIIKKIDEKERDGKFDEDVENDPPTKPLLPDDIEYLKGGLIPAIKRKLAFLLAHSHVRGLQRKGQFILKEIKGLEYLQLLKTGAVITCNHFSPNDSFAVQLAYERAKIKRKLYRVIREGNYTSFPGFYGFLMRNCYTLPLSSNIHTMKKFNDAVGEVLKRGDLVLTYPEQSMWYNYRKPKPLKRGAFILAGKSCVPVVPIFITMRDSENLDADGFFVQEYTVHIGKPIYPDPKKSYKENAEDMMEKNREAWQKIYESVYGMPLGYDYRHR